MKTRILSVSRRLFSNPALFASPGKQDRFSLLDAARGLAALAILFWHYQHFFYPIGRREPIPGYGELEPWHAVLSFLYDHGYLAVPVFWMISGFVFASVYCASGATTRQFAFNRFARLYPLHFLTLCIVAALQLIALARWGVTLIYDNNDLHHFLLQTAFASSWGLERGPSYNGPIWSVSVEVLIYAIFWAMHRWLYKIGILVPLLVAMAFAAAAVLVPGSQIGPCGVFFFFGSALYSAHGALAADRPMRLAAIAGMIVAGIAGFSLGSSTLARGVGVAGTFGGAILLLALVGNGISARYAKGLALIGDNTYGMYLWHVPVQLAIFLVLAGLVDIVAIAQSPWFLLFFLVSVSVVARLGFVFCERPMRTWLRRFGGAPAGRDRPDIAAP